MHPLMIPCSFALLLLLLLLFADAHSETGNLNEQSILPVDQPYDNNNTLTKSLITIETDIIAAKYTYLMKLRVKTSGSGGADYIETHASPDTGSDLIWLNVKCCCGDACHCCSCETSTTCIEKPEELPCDDKNCNALEKLKIKKTCSSSGKCMYEKTYADKLTTQGMLGTGEFRFPRIDDKFKKTDFSDNFKFGASTKSEGRLEQKSQGIVGLARGELSLLQQISRIDRKFSYCLPNPVSKKTESKIKFGHNVDTSDKSTPLLEDGVCKDRYCVHLATISVDGKPITVSEETNKVMAIDSGSTFTRLVNGLFNEFFKKVKDVIGHEPEKEKFEPYDNCFKESEAKKLTKVSFEFGGVGGSETRKMELKWENFFDRHTPDKGKTYYRCLTVVDGDEKKNRHARLYEDFGRENENSNLPHLLGNRAQMDFLVAFDLKDNKVSFDDMKSCGKEENLELSVLSE